MRRIVSFGCEDRTLVGTVDQATGDTGVLIVSGGNEVRCGAHRGMALLAARLASAGVPVFRFDRRGVGDSEGTNGGHASAGPDIAAAAAAFRHEQPQLSRILGFGNCDAATALLLLDRDCDTLVLANPWLGDENASIPPAAQRAHYRQRMADLHAWRQLSLRKLGSVLGSLFVAPRRTKQQPLARQVRDALGKRPTTIVLARGDRTAQIFAAGVHVPEVVRVVHIDTASHSFAGETEAIAEVLLSAICHDDKDVTDTSKRIQ